MPDNNTPIVLVVCNDYGELALVMYLLESQSFASNVTLMLPPRLHANNSDILPGRTFAYDSVDDIQKVLESGPPGILGLFSAYLLPVHRLCAPDELGSLLNSAQSKGWRPFTTDPFVGLLEDVEPGELVTLKSPRWSIFWSVFAVIERKRLSEVLTEMCSFLKATPHVYPIGNSQHDKAGSSQKRLRFHNPAFVSQPGIELPASAPMAAQGPPRWLYVLGDQDYTVQEGKYGQTIWATGISKRFRNLIRKLHETLEAGRVPTLIAPEKVIESVRTHSPVADTMELLPHCDFFRFLAMLRDAEYVFYWNATSFSCILRTLMAKPWFTFDDGHLIRGMNADYATRVSDWFYQGNEPPRLDINATLTCEGLQQATIGYLQSAWRIQHALLASPDPQALMTALAAGSPAPKSDSLT